MLFSCAHWSFLSFFSHNFRSKPCAVCPDIYILSGLYVKSLFFSFWSGELNQTVTSFKCWSKRFILTLHQCRSSTRSCTHKPGYVSVCQSAYWVKLMSTHTQYIKICWTLIYTDIKNCRYVDNRNNGFTKDCSLDHGSAIKDDSYSL